MTDEKKKMTAQGSSVGADDGQSISQITENSIPTSGQKSNDEIVNSQDSLEEMYRRMQRMTGPRYLHTLTMTELFQTTYKSRPPVVEGLLYAGAYILAGAPKIGKSFLVAQIAYHVSTGQDLWGYKVHQGTVLYLALEDDFQRIQSRMFMMYGVNDTPNLHFATAAGKIGNGLDEQLKNFVQEHPDTNLIIIDTMQKIREVGGEAYNYASDYAEQLLVKAKIWVKAGDSEKAVPLYQKALAIKDSASMSLANNQMEQIKSSYQLDKINMEQQRHNNRIRLIFLAVIIVVLFVLFIFMFRLAMVRKALKRSENEIRKAAATVRATNEIKNSFL